MQKPQFHNHTLNCVYTNNKGYKDFKILAELPLHHKDWLRALNQEKGQ